MVCPVKLTVIWYFLLGACELVHIFVQGKNTVIVILKVLDVIL